MYKTNETNENVERISEWEYTLGRTNRYAKFINDNGELYIYFETQLIKS